MLYIYVFIYIYVVPGRTSAFVLLSFYSIHALCRRICEHLQGAHSRQTPRETHNARKPLVQHSALSLNEN
jgi:hypothetical protein